MNDLLINPNSRQQIERFIAEPHHFLLLTASAGSGKLTVGHYIGAKLLGLSDPKALDSYPFFVRVTRPSDKSDIPIDSVRQMIDQLKLRTTGKGEVRRLVLVEDAHLLSEEAQNALLKTLEEPPADTQFIFTADSISNLKPTIASRAQNLELQAVSLDDARTYFKNQFDAKKIGSAWLLSGGRVGLLRSILEGDEAHELKKVITEAKNFLTASKYQRLLDTAAIGQNRQKLALFLEALQILLKTLQRLSIEKGKKVNQSKLVKALKLIHQYRESLDANANTRLVYLSLCLNLEVWNCYN